MAWGIACHWGREAAAAVPDVDGLEALHAAGSTHHHGAEDDAGIPGGIARVGIVGQEDGAVVVEDLVEDGAERVRAVGLVEELDDAVPDVLVGEGVDVEIGIDDVRLLVGIEAVADVGGMDGD